MENDGKQVAKKETLVLSEHIVREIHVPIDIPSTKTRSKGAGTL